jgi:hypothetical protein
MRRGYIDVEAWLKPFKGSEIAVLLDYANSAQILHCGMMASSGESRLHGWEDSQQADGKPATQTGELESRRETG